MTFGILVLTAIMFVMLGFTVFMYEAQVRKREKRLYEKHYADLDFERARAEQQFKTWKTNEEQVITKRAQEIGAIMADQLLGQWKLDYEEDIRKDAIKRSKAIVRGQVSEHFLPFMDRFPYDPKDARFLGSPVDFVIFDGLTNGDLQKIVFVEVKTGNSQLTRRESQIKEIVENQKICWEEIRLETKISEVPETVMALMVE